MWEIIPTLLASFWQIGLFSIGGGYATIPLIQEQVVQIHAWLTVQEFTDIITISQMTPGPIAVNTSTFVGLRVAGLPGAVTATFGCVISGFLISLLLYRFFCKHRETESVSSVLSGLRAASVGLIASASCTILWIAFFGTNIICLDNLTLNWKAVLLFAAALFTLRRWKRINPILVVLACGAVGVFLY